MSIISSQLKQELFEKTGGCYLRNEKFPVTSMEEETISGFNNFLYTNKKIFVQNNAEISDQHSYVTVRC